MKISFQCQVYSITKVKLLAWWKTFFGYILPSYITPQKHYKLSIHAASLLGVYVPIFKSSVIQICKIQLHLEKLLKQSNITVVQSLSLVQIFVIPWIAAHQAPLSSIISWCLLKLTCIEPMMLSNHPIFCCPFLLLPSIFHH